MVEELKKRTFPTCPSGTYVGTGEVEGYCMVLLPEQDTVHYRRKEAFAHANQSAIKQALKRAFDLAKDKAPNCGDCIATMSIVLSAPKEEKPYTESTPVSGLPQSAAHLIPKDPNAKYRIVVVSVTWTVRWVCLAEGSIEFAPNDAVVSTGSKIYIGNQAFDFGAPQPSKHNIVIKEAKYDQADNSRLKVETFHSRLDEKIREVTQQVQYQLWSELEAAVLQLPLCPPECSNNDMSITVGYPKPFFVKYKEVVTQKEGTAYEVVDGTYQAIKKMFDQTCYYITGEWSWSCQRNCDVVTKRK